MRRALEDGYELDDDPARIDAAAVHRYLSEESYWAGGRTREESDRAIAASARCVGLYAPDGSLAGFARVISDGVQIAYLTDVFVLAPHRGRGRGVALVREAVEGGPHARLLWLLGTRDAHGLYARLGFAPPDDRWLVRFRP